MFLITLGRHRTLCLNIWHGSIYRISRLIMCFFNDGIVRPPPAPACGTKSKWVRMVVGALISVLASRG
ncbi:MAG: hypothetical protein EZS28_019515 [Streblomastix strix]|uniref:Uncharacterized protein n=1 Tax=Streblomastix strix TaxID=222440 RepID=A0A5J4VRD2_9EUKA|nr:MAG: hypothetical protein EZS28_019515 [Streblomastix strix]